MGSNVEACDECSRNCLMIHHKHDPSPIVSSFFKVIYGKKISDMLMLPPRFVKFTSLVDQETYLEDSNGRKWDVVLSKVNGSLAFQKGWREFTQDHGIEVGDFAVFNYIMRSHFVVQIYGRTGCEKLRFSGQSKNMNKRAKTTTGFVAISDSSFKESQPSEVDINPCAISQQIMDATKRGNDSISSQRNGIEMSEVTPKTDFPEDSCFVLNRDTSSTQEDGRAYLFDLSTFERLDNKADKIQLQTNSCSKNEPEKHLITKANTAGCLKHHGHFSRKENSLPLTSYPSINDHKPLISNSPQMPSATLPKSDFSATSGKGVIDTKKFIQVLCGNPVAETSLNVSEHGAKLPAILPEAKINTGELGKEFSLMVKDKDGSETKVKSELADSCDNLSTLAIKVSCSVKPDGESFLELPEQLPLKMPRNGIKLEKKLVFLRDEEGRLWPVLYHQRNGFLVLANGWATFSKANKIQPGDKCTFVVENINESIFEVQIFRG